MKNPKVIALLQTLFYGFFTVATPLFIESLGQGGAFYGMLPEGMTIAVLFGLNLIDNYLSDRNGKAVFGMVA